MENHTLLKNLNSSTGNVSLRRGDVFKVPHEVRVFWFTGSINQLEDNKYQLLVDYTPTGINGTIEVDLNEVRILTNVPVRTDFIYDNKKILKDFI